MKEREGLITPSLLDSLAWLQDCPSSWRDRAYQGLRDTLTRQFTKTPAIERGMAIESKVCALLYGTKENFIGNLGPKVEPIYNRCARGKMQVVYKKKIVVDGQPYLVYGRADVVSADGTAIIDLKTTQNWKGPTSYLQKSQAPLYLYMAGDKVESFYYHVMVFSGEDSNDIVDFYEVPYCKVSAREFEMYTEEKIRDLMKYLSSEPKLLDAYWSTFTRA